MYKIVSSISYIVRQFFVPNPFTNLFESSSVAEYANYLFGGVLVPLSYFLTGTWYDKKEPIIGSVGFFCNYILLTYVFLIITEHITNLYTITVLCIIAYVSLCIVESKLFRKKYYY